MRDASIFLIRYKNGRKNKTHVLRLSRFATKRFLTFVDLNKFSWTSITSILNETYQTLVIFSKRHYKIQNKKQPIKCNIERN
jgi:hypothetical protein